MSNKDVDKSMMSKVFDCFNSGIGWGVEQIKSACPPKKKKQEPLPKEEPKPKESEDDCAPPPCKPKSSYILPSQICPENESCCVIKMQDPCAPCCCEPKPPPLPPCPPKCGPDEPREPICGCDLCKKRGYADRVGCCDQTAAYHGSNVDPRCFENA